MKDTTTDRAPFLALWLTAALASTGGAAALLAASDRYAWALRLADLPIVAFAVALAAAGLVVAALLALIRATLRGGHGNDLAIFLVIVTAGVAMRALMIPSTPVLEDDFYRYLWDGAVTAHGVNPYAYAPKDALIGATPATISELADDGRGVLERVNHPALKTIYPPVAQAAFAAAYLIEPWSLRAWRVVCLTGELTTFALAIGLLGMLARPRVWIALYWLNPLVVKELMNSAHMEAIVLPFVMATVVLLARRRIIWASAALGFAIGAKVWPALLAPLVLGAARRQPGRLVAAAGLLGLLCLIWTLAPIAGGLDERSGFVAYAQNWQTNSALFQTVLRSLRLLCETLALPPEWAGPGGRLLVAGIAGTGAILAAWRPLGDARDVVSRAAFVAILVFFVSPAQFPWYATWALVFLPFVPLLALIGATVLLPLYYVSFHFITRGEYGGLAPWLVYAEWGAIWVLLGIDGLRSWCRPLTIKVGAPVRPRTTGA